MNKPEAIDNFHLDYHPSGHPLRDADLLPYWMLRLTNDMRRRWNEEIRREGLNVAAWQVLSIIQHYGGVRIGRIAELMLSEQALISRTVDHLEQNGWVERRSDPDDHRANLVWITAQGRENYLRLVPNSRHFVEKWTERIGIEKANQLARLLAEMNGPID